MPRFSKWIPADPSDQTLDVAIRSLEARMAAVEYYLPLAAEHPEDDVEHVHQLRVWSRRATAVFATFRDLLPRRRAARLEDQLKKIRRAAGEARDLDVFALRLASDSDDPAARWLAEHVRARREKAQRPLMKIHHRLGCSGRLERHTAKLLRKTRRRSDRKDARMRFDRWAGDSLRPVARKFFKAAEADFSTAEPMHRFRIRGKQLRYAIELVAAAYPPEFRKRLYPVVERLQDRLGEVNDHDTARARLRCWLDVATTPAHTEYIERLRCDEATAFEAQCLRFRRWWTPQREHEFREEFERLMG